MEAELEQLTADAQVAPARVIVSEAQDQFLRLALKRRPVRSARSFATGDPTPAHEFAMSAEQGGGPETQAIDLEVTPDGGEDKAIDWAELESLDLTSKHRDFMTKQHQLELNLGRRARADAD